MIYTIGYSNKSIKNLKKAFYDLKIDILIDIRMNPYSRFNPLMKKKSLESIFGNKYQWVRELGGDLDIRNQDFKSTIAEIIKSVDEGKNIMLMCCERDYRKCHRLLITDYLEETGFTNYRHIDIANYD